MSNRAMEKRSYPVTPAVRLLREKKIAFGQHLYDWEEKGGTARAAAELGIVEHAVIKTLLMETETRKPLIILMHGDREVSTKQLARSLDAKTVSPCAPQTAQKLSGYMVGGISPFGTRTKLSAYVEASVFDLPQIYVNGGRRGFLVSLNPQDLRLVLPVTEVQVAIGSVRSET